MNYESQFDIRKPILPQMVGKTFKEVFVKKVGNDALIFRLESGESVVFSHYQDCCEHVYIESVVGDLADLVGEPLLLAEESVQSQQSSEGYSDGETWTFYKFATRKGYVDVRWCGSSNGYYSERVDVSLEALEGPNGEIIQHFVYPVDGRR